MDSKEFFHNNGVCINPAPYSRGLMAQKYISDFAIRCHVLLDQLPRPILRLCRVKIEPVYRLKGGWRVIGVYVRISTPFHEVYFTQVDDEENVLVSVTNSDCQKGCKFDHQFERAKTSRLTTKVVADLLRKILEVEKSFGDKFWSFHVNRALSTWRKK